MPKSKLSASTVASLTIEKGKVQTDYFDTELHGFGVRVSARKKVYFIQCKVKGQFNTSGKPLELKHTLDPVTDKLDETGRRRPDTDQFTAMYAKARKIIEDAKVNGKTPKDRDIESREQDEANRNEGERLRKIEEAKDVTLSDIVKKYIKSKVSGGKLKESTSGQYLLSLETHCADWLDQPARNITKAMIEQRHADISKRETVEIKAGEKVRGGNKRVRGGKGTADATMRILRAVFNYAIGIYEDADAIIRTNPVGVLKAIGKWHNLDRRESSVATDQLKDWFKGIHAIENPAMRTILEVTLFTGARKEEVTSLKWSDVDIVSETPYARFRTTKNGKELLFPIPQHVVNLLKDYKKTAYSGPDGFMFPSWGKSGHIKDPRRSIKKAVEAGGVQFMPHDSRRTFLSFCNHEELQVQQWTQKRLCNHAKPQDVTQGYVQHELKSLALTVERIAAFILKHAGMAVPPPVEVNLEEQTEQNQTASNVISLEERRTVMAA
jgi:integrase